MERAIKLYEMMAARFRITGWSPCQSAIYAEIAEFMRNECATIEEAEEKLKNSPLFLAPSVALVKDKVNALIRAAEDDDIEGVADVYRQKLAEIERDASAIHDAAYLTAAHNLYIKYFARIDAFKRIYSYYLEVQGNYEFSGGDEAFRLLAEDLKRYGGNFADCVRRPEFREVIPANDTAYQRFVQDTLHYLSNPPAPALEYERMEKCIDAIWSRFNSKQIEEVYRTLRGGRGACLVIAPPDEHGDYEYTETVTFKNE